MKTLGMVYLVGAGCGTFDLITLRGINILQQCNAVVYDSLIDIELLNYVPEEAEKICVGKRAGSHSETQEGINKILIQKAQEGKTVVRLKGGDPLVFGRGGEEILALQKFEIPYSIVPGISSAIAVPELAGIPVTHRRISRSFHVITGHTVGDMLPEKMHVYAKLEGTLVFLMGLKNCKYIAESLIKGGKSESTPVAVISNGASKNQIVLRSTLCEIEREVEKQKISTPAIIVVGETSEFNFSNTIKYPLDNICVTITGTKSFTSKLSSQLLYLGANVKKLNCLKVNEYQENVELEKALLNIEHYAWIVLTSVNGAEIFLKQIRRYKIDIRRLYNLKIAVIGSGTAEIFEKIGVFPDLIPNTFTALALGEKLASSVLSDEKILIMRAERGSADLTKILDKNSIIYDDIKTYDVISDCEKINITEVKTDFLTFASASGVKSFFDKGFRISDKTKIICIGEITAQELIEHNVHKFIVSKIQNINGMIDSILHEVQNLKI